MFKNNNIIMFGSSSSSSSHNQMLDNIEYESDVVRATDEVNYESPMEDVPSGAEQQRRPKRKSRSRHTEAQIQAMEAFFQHCPHPNDKQRKDLSRELGLELLQVKFWFQNKRTQLKAQRERQDNGILKAENEKLRAENSRYKEALTNVPCNQCGNHSTLGEMSFEEQHLRIENARLKEQIARMSGENVGNTMTSVSSSHNNNNSQMLELGAVNYGAQTGMLELGSGTSGGDHLGRSFSVQSIDAERPMIVELAVIAMEELVKLAKAGPFDLLWVPTNHHIEALNEDVYNTMFPSNSKHPGLRTEASRESTVVNLNYTNLIELLMNVKNWSTLFCGIVSKAFTLETLSTGVAGNYNGALQVMSAEFQISSPFVATRENYFVRYCKQLPDGIWAIVDASLENMQPAAAASISRSQRRPSGCLIQEMPNGHSKVTWVEHVEVDDRTMPNMYRPLVLSGLAFGAKRWLSILERQCERLACSIAGSVRAGELDVAICAEGRKSMVKLSQRMVASFSTCVGASTAHANWTTLPSTGVNDVRVMTRKNTDDPGKPFGIVFSATTTFWLPSPPKTVFDFLRRENSRNEWDILSNGEHVQEIAHIANGTDLDNYISLLRVNSTPNVLSNMLILQENCTDSTGSYIVYAPVDLSTMNMVLSGGDSDNVALLPSGFAILPDGPGSNGGPINNVGSGGTLLTVAFQILVDYTPGARICLNSVSTINTLIKATVERIKLAVSMRSNTTSSQNFSM